MLDRPVIEKVYVIFENSTHELYIERRSRTGVYMMGVFFPGWICIDRFIEWAKPTWKATGLIFKAIERI